MNYREKIRKAIECPQFGDDHYGEWGTLRLDQRKLIKRLLDELDRADDCLKRLYLRNYSAITYVKEGGYNLSSNILLETLEGKQQ